MNGRCLLLRIKCCPWKGHAKRWCSFDRRKLKTDDFVNRDNQPLKETAADFDKLMEFYRQKARNSVLIRCAPSTSLLELKASLLPFAAYVADKKTICYQHSIGDNKLYKYYLCDIGRENVDKLIKNLGHLNTDGVPARLRLLFLGNGLKRTTTSSPSVNMYSEELNVSRIQKSLSTALSFDDQMNRLVDETELKPPGVAIRFFVASLIEDLFSGIFPLAVCTPFGSTLNGFGKKGGDLDMCLEFQDPFSTNRELQKNGSSRLYIMSKNSSDNSNERSMIQKTLNIFGAVLATHVPFCNNVQRILQARVPIIKFNMSCCALNCDLTTNNNTGTQMAKILWLYTQLDPRVKPLVFSIRHWAKSVGVTHSMPGPWLTNFHLVCLLLFFMQSNLLDRYGETNLPAIKNLRQHGQKTGSYGIFSRSTDVIYSPGSLNKVPSPLLLLGFFDFYSKFNFDKHGLCLETGQVVNKLQDSAMIIQNPLEKDHNVTKNVTQMQLELFLGEVVRAADTMRQISGRNERKDNAKWGLLKLCDRSNSNLALNFNDNSHTDRTNFVGQSKIYLKPLFEECKLEQSSEDEIAIWSKK